MMTDGGAALQKLTSHQSRPTMSLSNNNARDMVTLKEGYTSVRGWGGAGCPGRGEAVGVKSQASEPRCLGVADPAFVLLSCMLLPRLCVSHHYSEDNAKQPLLHQVSSGLTRWKAMVLKKVGHRSTIVGHGDQSQKKIKNPVEQKMSECITHGKISFVYEALLCVYTGYKIYSLLCLVTKQDREPYA